MFTVFPFWTHTHTHTCEPIFAVTVYSSTVGLALQPFTLSVLVLRSERTCLFQHFHQFFLLILSFLPKHSKDRKDLHFSNAFSSPLTSQSTSQQFTFTHWWQRLLCDVQTGWIWGSVSCSRLCRRGSQGIKLATFCLLDDTIPAPS